jgi:hypothetical protein
MEPKTIAIKLSVENSELEIENLAAITNGIFDTIRRSGISEVIIRPNLKSEGDDGQKGDPVSTSTLLVTLGVAALPGLIGLLKDWFDARRESTRMVNLSFEVGQVKITFPSNQTWTEDRIIEVISRLSEENRKIDNKSTEEK